MVPSFHLGHHVNFVGLGVSKVAGKNGESFVLTAEKVGPEERKGAGRTVVPGTILQGPKSGKVLWVDGIRGVICWVRGCTVGE